MKLFLAALAGVASLIAATAWCATADETYKAKCSTCHDAGLAGTPKIGDKVEWARRNQYETKPWSKHETHGTT